MIKQLFILFLLPITLLAQNDPKAESILKKVSETNKAYTDISVDFSYTLENKKADVNDTRDGSLVLSGNKFRLQLMGQDIYSDGSIVWYVMKEDEEVHVKSVEEFKAETDLDPANIFSQYDKGFKSKFHADEDFAGKAVSVVDLFPEDPGKKPYSRVRLAVDKKTNHIVYSKTFGKDGTDYQLEVKSMKTNAGISSDLFTYNEAKFESEGYDVVDFR